MDREEIIRALCDNLKAARQRHNAASECLDDAIRCVPGGIPYPWSRSTDNQGGVDAERFRASSEYRHTREDVQNALSKLNNYLIHGTVPPELDTEGKPPAKETSSPADKKKAR